MLKNWHTETMGKYNDLFAKCARFEYLVKMAGLVEDLKLKHPHLVSKIDFFVQRDKTRKYLQYEVKTLLSGQALENEIADVIELFHKFKDKLDKKDINAWNFTGLRDKLFELRDFGGDKSKRKNKKELKEEIKKIETSGAEKLYEDEQCELLYVANKAQACFYGKGTKWCITMENEHYFEDYQGQNVVFYYVLRKGAEAIAEEANYAKIAISVPRTKDNEIVQQEVQYWEMTDVSITPESAFYGLHGSATIPGIINQDAPHRPMGFLAKLNLKPEELSFEDYTKNMTEQNKVIVAEKTDNMKVLAFLAKSDDQDILSRVACNIYTDSKTLDHLSKNQLRLIRAYVASHLGTTTETLARLAHDEQENVREQVAFNRNTRPETLRLLAKSKSDTIARKLAGNKNTPSDVLSELAKRGDYTKLMVAANPGTPVETLEQLAKTYSVLDIQKNVFNNPSFPDALRTKYFPGMTRQIDRDR